MNRKEIFSKNLIDILESRQEKQIDVAKAIGVSQQTFNNWCTGVAIPRMDKIQALADYFHISMSNLIESANKVSDSLSQSAEEIAKAAALYEGYINANPEIQNMIDSLLKLSQSMPVASEIPYLKSSKPAPELPHLKKDSDK